MNKYNRLQPQDVYISIEKIFTENSNQYIIIDNTIKEVDIKDNNIKCSPIILLDNIRTKLDTSVLFELKKVLENTDLSSSISNNL